MIAGLAYRWLGMPCEADVGEDSLRLVGRPHTDLFANPRGDAPELSASAFVTPVAGDFLLSARVTVGFAAAFDAGGLLVHAAGDRWAKLCFECSPALEPAVVSVVTRGVSDDCMSLPVEVGEMRLRIARMGGTFAFHASPDGVRWRFIRYFALDVGPVLDLGFVAQSPRGEGCTAGFTEIRFERATLQDLHGGE